MKAKFQDIYPESDLFLTRKDKENLIGQRAKVLWLTGLSGSGKTTIANHLEKKLHNEGFLVKVFDGDIVRSKINKELDFSEEGRLQNIKRIAEINREFLDCGIIVINCFISPSVAMRTLAEEIIGKDDFIEIYLNCPLHICESRDVKGLYSKARKGLIKNFTGIGSPYEPPKNPQLEIDTEKKSLSAAVDIIYNYITPKIKTGK